jgi:hypothetical protein
MCCFADLIARFKRYIESHDAHISLALFIFELISTLSALIMGILGITKWASFSKTEYENNGYYYFKKGINQSNINLDKCTIFDIDSIEDFEVLFIKQKFLITLQFWSSLVILFIFQVIDLFEAYKKRNKNKSNDDKTVKKILFQELGIFRTLMKFLFVPGVFMLDNIDIYSPCVYISLPINIIPALYASYKVFPYVSGLIALVFLTSLCENMSQMQCCCDCFENLNEKFIKFVKYSSLVIVSCLLLISVFLFWLGLAGSLISIIDSILLSIIMLIAYLSTRIQKLLK